jgi:hypothetical protein
MSQIEEWKPVIGWPEYQVSSFGNVRGRRGNLRTFLAPRYLSFNVIRGKARRLLRVHIEVAKSFWGNFSGQLIVRHLDGNPFNNNVKNLAWGTGVENEADKRRHGRTPLGERHHHAKLTNDAVIQIRTSSAPLRVLAATFGVSMATVSHAKRGDTWSHV